MASAITQIPDHYVTKFDQTWRHLVQQAVSRLRDTVSIDSFEGKEKKYNQIDSTAMNLITGRSQVTQPSDINLPDRWLRTSVYDKAFWQDEWDETFLGEVSSPTSAIMEASLMAYLMVTLVPDTEVVTLVTNGAAKAVKVVASQSAQRNSNAQAGRAMRLVGRVTPCAPWLRI